MKKKITLLLMMLLALAPIHASTLSDKKDKLSSNEQNIKDKQAEVNKKQEQQEKIQAEML